MEKKWIQKAIKHKGALRKAAKKAGKLTKEGNINKEWIDEMSKKKGIQGRRARLAKTLGEMHKGADY